LHNTNENQTKRKKEKIHRKQYGVKRGDGHLTDLFTKEFTMEELKEATKNISDKKQPGPDKIFPEFIKNLGSKATDTLLLACNKFWTSKMSLPADWTKAIIIPILKPGKPTEEMESYRPITLTSILVKVFERIILTRPKWFPESQNLLVEEQDGFRNMSTSNSLMRFVQDVKQGFNQKKSTLAVFIDFKRAYNTVWRSKLMSKLKMYGVRGNMLSWFGRFLAQTWVKVQWDEAESKYKQ